MSTTGSPTSPPHLLVAAAVIERGDGVFVTRRPHGAHLAGTWEFPGGKCDAGESLEDCLRREIVEELDCRVRVGPEIYTVTHAYPERIVELHFFACELESDPQPALGQEMLWVDRRDLQSLEFPPADAELVAILQTRPGASQGPLPSP